MIIYQKIEHVNEEGATVFELVPYVDRVEFAGRKYFAIISHTLATSQGPVPDHFRRDIDAAGIAEAFEKLAEILKTASADRVRELQAQQAAAARQLVLPSGQALPPAGKPKTVFH